MVKNVLIIDDDAKLIGLLTDYLASYGFKVMGATTPEEGLRMARRGRPDAVILDVMLPGKDGFTVCKEIRAESDVPIIMLTARGEVTDRVVGLELGADDYLPKPFEPRELVARIQSILRRSKEPSRPKLVFGPLEIDMQRRTVELSGEPIELTTTEFDLLVLLAKNPGKAFDRDELIDGLRGAGWETSHRTIDVAMSRLRQKLGDDPKDPRFFKTIWGTGYMFIGQETE